MHKTNEELEIEHEALQDHKPRSKIPLIISTVIVIALILSYFFLGPFHYIIAGLFHSEMIEGNIIKTNDITIILQNNTKEIITNAWNNNINVETTLCLQGQKFNNTYIIQGAYQPKIYSQSFKHVTHAPCVDTIIMFHTQPYKSCLASETDFNTLRKTNISMIIMCENQRLNFYENN